MAFATTTTIAAIAITIAAIAATLAICSANISTATVTRHPCPHLRRRSAAIASAFAMTPPPPSHRLMLELRDEHAGPSGAAGEAALVAAFRCCQQR